MTANTFLPAGVLLLSLLCSVGAQAMSIFDFGRMNLDDESTYVSLLVDGSAKLLRARGKPAQAQKAIDLFKDSSKDGGVNQFILNLKALNAENDRNSTNAKNAAPVYEVEDAMSMTLRDHGIIVSVKELLAINQNFAPAGPPRSTTPAN